MEVFILHILKLNIIAAVVILLVKVLATLFKGRVSARWKYLIWLLITISLCVPVRLPANLALVDFKVLRSSQQNTQNPKITDYVVRPEESQKITENVSSASNDMKNLTEIPEQKRTVRYESDKWLGIVALIFAAVWLSVAVLKLTGELLAYYFSIRNLERMSLQVSFFHFFIPPLLHIFYKCRNNSILPWFTEMARAFAQFANALAIPAATDHYQSISV